MKNKFNILILAFVLFFGRPSLVLAQQIKVSVIPPQVEILMKPGLSLIKAFNFENLADPGVFYLKVVSFRSSGDQGNIELLDKAEGPIRFTLENSEIEFGKRFFLKSRERTQAIVKIRSVENAPVGDYYYTLLLISEPPSSQASVGRGSAMLGANILISITENGFTPTSVKIAQFQIIPHYKFNFFGRTYFVMEPGEEIPVILKLANTGNYLVAPEAKLTLKGPYGVTQTKKLLNQNILRNSERLLLMREIEVCQNCQTQPSVVFHRFSLGKYVLSADIGFSGLNQKIFATTEFWSLPIKLTKIVVGLFLGMSVLLWFLSRQRHRHH